MNIQFHTITQAHNLLQSFGRFERKMLLIIHLWHHLHRHLQQVVVAFHPPGTI